MARTPRAGEAVHATSRRRSGRPLGPQPDTRAQRTGCEPDRTRNCLLIDAANLQTALLKITCNRRHIVNSQKVRHLILLHRYKSSRQSP
jgi:hypothetical protein